MKIIKPTTIEEFESLKRGDIVIVRWWKNWVKHHEGAQTIMSYSIARVKKNQSEVILRVKGNHYFNYRLYLGLEKGNASAAEEVLIIKEEV